MSSSDETTEIDVPRRDADAETTEGDSSSDDQGIIKTARPPRSPDGEESDDAADDSASTDRQGAQKD